MSLRDYQENVNRKYREDELFKFSKQAATAAKITVVISGLALIVALISLFR